MNDSNDRALFDFVFLVGCGRSGTSWLQRVIATHPEIATGPETRLFEHLRPLLRAFEQGLSADNLSSYLSQEEFLDRTRDYIRSLFANTVREADASCFLEKAPPHGWYLPEMHRLFPDAPIVHLIRDGRDVACSHVAISEKWILSGWEDAPTTIPEALDLWVEYVAWVRQRGAELGPLYLEVRYEDLVADPEPQLASIFRHLRLDYSSNLVRREMKHLDRAMPIRTEIGSWQTQFTESDHWYCRKVAGELLMQLGYGGTGNS